MKNTLLLPIVALVVGACSTPKSTGESNAVAPSFASMTIDGVYWLDDARLPEFIQNEWKPDRPSLAAHVVEWQGFPAMKQFTLEADKNFALKATGRPSIPVRMATGGMTGSDGQIRFVHLYVSVKHLSSAASKLDGLDRSISYRLIPANSTSALTWIVNSEVQPVQQP